MNILQINVCLDKGGAAKVALGLHKNLQTQHINSHFAYGWGEKGGRSASEASVESCFRIGSRLQVIANFFVHNLIGLDIFIPHGKQRRGLEKAIQAADVVHLHVVHSYYLRFSWLIDAIYHAKKPIVWTAHDYWILTGRCASVGDCSRWKSGCGDCPKTSSYPSTSLDLSGAQFKSKREALEKISSNLVIVSPSKFLADELAGEFPNVEVHHISNWLDEDFEYACRKKIINNEIIKLPLNIVKILIVSNNLNDQIKVNVQLINDLLALEGVELHTIGNNSPFTGVNVVNHGEISDRTKMVDVISLCDAALFTSKIDSFGLVMIEALSCGLPVLAIESKASRELLLGFGIQPIESFSDILELVRLRKLPVEYDNLTKSFLKQLALNKFSGQAAAESYINVYKRLVLANKKR